MYYFYLLLPPRNVSCWLILTDPSKQFQYGRIWFEKKICSFPRLVIVFWCKTTKQSTSLQCYIAAMFFKAVSTYYSKNINKIINARGAPGGKGKGPSNIKKNIYISLKTAIETHSSSNLSKFLFSFIVAIFFFFFFLFFSF